MPHIQFIGKGKVDGRAYDKGNTLDVDEATKSRLLKEGCIKNDGDASDCSELQEELDNVRKVLDGNSELISELLSELANAKKLEEFKAIQEKYKKVD